MSEKNSNSINIPGLQFKPYTPKGNHQSPFANFISNSKTVKKEEILSFIAHNKLKNNNYFDKQYREDPIVKAAFDTLPDNYQDNFRSEFKVGMIFDIFEDILEMKNQHIKELFKQIENFSWRYNEIKVNNEKPVDLETFIRSPEYLNLPEDIADKQVEIFFKGEEAKNDQP